MHALRTLAFAGWVGLVLPANAAVVESPTLTLGEVIDHIVQRRGSDRLVQARLNQADAQSAAADSLLAGAPAISLRYQNDTLGSDDGLQEWETGLELPLWNPGQREARRGLAEGTRSDANAQNQTLRWEIAGQLRDRLWAWELAELRADLAERAVQSALALEADVKKRVELGELPRTDLLLASEETLARRTEHADALAAAQEAATHYQALTGRSELPADRREIAAADTPSLSDTHPLLAQGRASVAKARAERDVARSERRENPSLTLGSRHEKPLRGAGYDNSIGITLRLPLGSSAHEAAPLAAAETGVTEAELELAQLHHRLETDLQTAALRLDQGKQTLKLARQAQSLATESLRLARVAFQAGESDLVSLLRARDRALSAERALRERELELNRYVAQLNQAAGVLP
ncbi:MAG: TolC family protein [Chromatiales bacterium]|nr:TolC family protein [Chromatiales bacterium]